MNSTAEQASHTPGNSAITLTPEQWKYVFKHGCIFRGWKLRKVDDDIKLSQGSDDVFEYKDFIPNYNASQEKAYVIKNNYKGQVKYKFLDKAFSESSIKVALETGIPGCAVGLKNDLSFKEELSREYSGTNEDTATYCSCIILRVILELTWSPTPPTIVLSEKCRTFIDQHCDPNDVGNSLIEFQCRFGSLFAKQVWLGSRRNEKEMIQEQKQTDAQGSSKTHSVGGGAQVPVKVVTVDVQGNYTSGGSKNEETDRQVKINRKVLETVGGEIEIFDNIDSWLGSTKDHTHWMPIMREDVVELLPLVREVLTKDPEPSWWNWWNTSTKAKRLSAIDAMLEKLLENKRQAQRDLDNQLIVRISTFDTTVQKRSPLSISKLHTWIMHVTINKPSIIDSLKLEITGFELEREDLEDREGVVKFSVSRKHRFPLSSYEGFLLIDLQRNYKWANMGDNEIFKITRKTPITLQTRYAEQSVVIQLGSSIVRD